MPATGFQAIILCGPGESLHPFSSSPKDFPKALIPIANRPMIWYPLEWCYRMGVTNIHLITPHESRNALDAALSQNPHLTSLPSPKPSIIAPESLTLTTGTAEIFRLRQVQDVITGDFIVLPCDIVCGMNGQSLLEVWMTLQGGLESQNNIRLQGDFSAEKAGRRGGLGVWYDTKDSAEGAVGVKKEETDFIALTDLSPPIVPHGKASLRPHIYNLALTMPRAELKGDDDDKQPFLARHALIRSHGRIRMRMTYRDAHLYFLPYWIKEFIKRNENFKSLSEDVIGSWAKAGWQKRLAGKLGLQEVFNDCRHDEAHGNDQDDGRVDIANLRSTFSTNSMFTSGRLRFRNDGPCFASRVGDIPAESKLGKEGVTVPAILSYTHPAQPSAPLLRRVDTVALLLSASLYLAKLPSAAEAHTINVKPSPFAHAHKVPPTTVLPPQVTIHQPTVLLDANVTLTSKSTIRECVVGANCVLGTVGNSGVGVRLNRCLIMEGAVIESGNVLNGCVLGRRCKVGAGCDLRDCYVQEGYIVPEGTTSKGEVFARFDEGDGEEELGDLEERVDSEDAQDLPVHDGP